MEDERENGSGRDTKRLIGLIGGPALAVILLVFTDLQPGSPLVTRCAAVAVWMATWWITEAIPIAATALLPVAMFPLLGIMSGKATAGTYFNNVILLFIGGFIIALAMERWDLHRRIALRIILLIGISPHRIILGFMVATFFLSMWISNTATTMMMVPMAMAIIVKMKDTYGPEKVHRIAVGLLIAVAYAASIGGTATLIGTPPNLAFARILTITFPHAPDISFSQWMIFALPMAVIFLVVTWLLLTKVFVGKAAGLETDSSIFREELAQLGPLRYEEKIILVAFGLVAFLWLFRQNIALGAFTIPGWSHLFPQPKFIDDGTVAICVSLLLFLIPSKQRSGGPRVRLMDWKTATRLHWGIVILFGGGFALAAGFEQSGLAAYLGNQLAGLKQLPPLLIVVAVCALLTFLTEVTSNTATTQIFLPILAALAAAITINPLLLMIPATLSASCAFMLPVATPPNAIVFGTGEVRMQDMVRVGIIMNMIGIILITATIYLLGVHVFGIDLSAMPAWAQ
jgi:sodium-dependent dicarboxylate transporter 2/3/5